jgi:hypothetical protein
MKPWSKLNHQHFHDYHKTLSLTYHLLSTIETKYLHPYFIHLFGETACIRGDDVRNQEWKREVLRLTNGIPPSLPNQGFLRPANFDSTLVSVIQAASAIPALTPVLFYLVILGDDSLFEEWATRGKLEMKPDYLGLKNTLKDEPDLKWHVLCYFLRLIRWEWEDRTRLSIQILDLGFKFNASQIRSTWCLFASADTKWRTRLGDYLYYNRLVWHPDLTERSRSAPYDLATFSLLIQELRYSISFPPQNRWYRRFLHEFGDENLTPTEVVRYVLMLQSEFGALAFAVQNNYILLENNGRLFTIGKKKHGLMILKKQ